MGGGRGQVAQALVSVNPVFLGSWVDALRPVRTKLLAPLATIFTAKIAWRASTRWRRISSRIMPATDPDRLAELLLVSDPKAYVSLFPVAEKRAQQVLPILRTELVKTTTYSWDDPPLIQRG